MNCCTSLVACLCGALSISGCASIARTPVPQSLAEDARLQDFGQIRYWGDTEPPGLEARARANLERIRAARTPQIAAGESVRIEFLALSGGGTDGAFGAGLLNGWTQTGDRPQFQIVTGVSTGAIIAPFAFLGPSYDDELLSAYTETSPDEIYTAAVLPNLVRGPALADANPLVRLIESHTDSALLEAIAREHETGRRLLVATTNLDAGRPVIWDLGAIAAEGGPEALNLFRKILLASASIPGLFPPVQIEVVADGRQYTELHVDGGVTSQVFFYQPQVELGRLLDEAEFETDINLYIVHNGRAHPLYDPTDPVWYRIMTRSLDVFLHHLAIADIYRIYYLAQRDELNFCLAFIPENFDQTIDQPFDQTYMRSLFGVAEAMARNGFPWRRSPLDEGLTSAACEIDPEAQ